MGKKGQQPKRKKIDKEMLGKILYSLNSIPDVNGSVIIDKEGSVILDKLPPDVNADTYGSMATTLSGSAKEILKYTRQGDMTGIIIEASNGKIFISDLSEVNLNLIVITNVGVNLGLLRVEAKKSGNQIISLLTEKPLEIPTEVKPSVEVEIPTKPEVPVRAVVEKPKIEKISLPEFPEIPKNVKIPEDPKDRASLIFDIYKAIFLAISIGSSRIAGIASTRGMIKRALPVKKCPELLYGVSVKENATLDFELMRNNIERIPVDKREKLIRDEFDQIISAIVDFYAKIMGYEPLRGMTRREMRLILEGYGEVMEKLGIKTIIKP